MMYKVLFADVDVDFPSLETAMAFAKELDVFVTIKGKDFEVCGKFGVDSVVDGKCPDGVKYDWDKSARIGRVKRERVA
jgi:hypothetical protein